MSGFRIEDEESSDDQSSSGFGTAGVLVAAGAGIGALLYYFLNKRQGDYEAEQFFRDRAGSIEICSICYGALMRRQHVTSLRCGHNYHSQCISPWFRHNRTCPMCRTVV